MAWALTFALFFTLLPRFSTPQRPVHAYALFDLICLAPWAAYLAVLAVRRGGSAPAALAIQQGTVLAVTYPVHTVVTNRKFWEYFQEPDRLLGVRFGGVPIEEFAFYPLMLGLAVLFYWLIADRLAAAGVSDWRVDRRWLRAALLGGSVLCLAVAIWSYAWRGPADVAAASLTWDEMSVPHYAEGPRDHAWATVCLTSLAAVFALLYAAERSTPMLLRAVVPASAIFVVLGLLVELGGNSRAWWVYNAQHASGWWIGSVPLESVAMYLCGVPETVAVLELSRRLLGDRTPG